MIFRSVFWYTHLLFSVIGRTPLLWKMRRLKETTPPPIYDQMIHEIAQKWSVDQIRWSGSRFHVIGAENLPEKGPVLYVANHQSIYDVGVFTAYLPFPKGFIAKKEILKLPLIRTWMKEMGCIFLDRASVKNAAHAILEGIALLKGGHSMVVFPEGHRSRGGPPGEFKAGSFKLATKAKVPIVPVTIDGSYKAMEANHFLIRPADIFITIHPKIETAGLSREETLLIPEKVKAVILSALP
jgi:1-acyl-sn-glycerol-3-phosphate acyltransferase